MLLCGDIGGTKALLGIAELRDGQPHFLFERRYLCAEQPDFHALWRSFRADAAEYAGDITGGCLAVAGPIEDDGLSARLTNLPWVVDAAREGSAFGLPPLKLVNDFAAAAIGITAADAATRHCLQAGEALAEGVRLVIGPGTGLGMALLLPHDDHWQILPGEGGHVGFAPRDALQAELWAHCHQHFGRVTNERLLSGQGLATLYRFLARRGVAELPDPDKSPDPAAAVTALALTRPGGTAHRAVQLFLSILGAVAGDMALAALARGGVFLAGGIVRHLLPLLHGAEASTLLEAFNDKAEHARLARRMPVYAMGDPALGIKGAALLATR